MKESDDAFVERYRPLVLKIVGKVRGQLGLQSDADELIAYGMRGLVEAHSRFDPSRGVQFSSFAYYRIRGAVLDGVREMAYLPRKVHARRKIAETLDREAESVGERRAREPGVRGHTKETLEAMERVLARTTAAYVISALGQDEVHDATPEDNLVLSEQRHRLRTALDLLDGRERTLVEGYYFHDRTLEEMGAEMGISKSWASRICSKALSRLREALEGG